MADLYPTADNGFVTADSVPTGDLGTAPPSPRRYVYTKDDLVARVLVRLGEVGFGQSAEPEARARVDGSLRAIMAELALDKVYDFPLDDEVPAAAFDPLSAIIASRLADDFGLPENEAVLLAGRAQGAEARLRRYRADVCVYTPARPDYF